MPIYEYRCTSCGHQQEFLQKVNAPPVTVCTACGKPTFAKMLTAAGFQLKGSGWYATDFRNTGAPAAKSSDSSGESKGESKGDSKGESKGESKTEAKSEPKTESTSAAKSESKPEIKTASKGDAKSGGATP